MDITFSDDRENNTSLDTSEIKCTVTPVESDKVAVQSDQSRQHRVALADIQNSKDADNDAYDNEKLALDVEECVKDMFQEQSSDALKDVWGAHLNINADKVLDFGTKKLKQRSGSFHFSEKLFVGSKFSKKNPRKSRSFTRPSKVIENDGFPVLPLSEVRKMSSEHLPVDHQEHIKSHPSNNNRNGTESTRNPNSEFSLKGLLEEKFKVVTNSTPVTNQAISVIHRAALSAESCQQKLTPSRTVDKGWLDRCTKSNSLEYQVTPANDSGIESVGSSRVTDHCSSIECTPKHLKSYSDVMPQLLHSKSEQHLTLPDITGNENRKTVVAVSDDSDEDIICNSEESENEGQTVNIRGITCGSKRKLYSSDFVSLKTSAKRQKSYSKDISKIEAADDTLIDIPSAADIDKMAEAIVSAEKDVKKKNCTTTSKLSKKEILEKKMSTGCANDNYVRINIKKKVYVRGRRNNNYSKYKKAEWKKKRKIADSAVADAAGKSSLLKCLNCGDVGHFARNCLNAQGQ